MRYGLIGTGTISAEFAQALQATKNAHITAVYSRSIERAQEFIHQQSIDARAYDSVQDLCSGGDIDAVYIASPNSLHATHALTAIDADIHVVVEKPAVWNPQQWDQVWSAAQKANVLVFEAARHIYEPAQEIIKEQLVESTPASVRLNYSQYSSRWDAVLAGDTPNIFSPVFGGGALVDLGIYAVYNAVFWFGQPDTIKYFPTVAPTGVDGAGTMVLMYDDFNVVITIAKNAQSNAPSEILLGHETIRLSSLQGIDRISKYSKDAENVLYESGAEPGSRSLAKLMTYEATFFTEMFASHADGGLSDQEIARYRELALLSRTVNDVCTTARYESGLFFDGETVEFQ